MGFSRTVSGGTGVPVLRLSPHVGGCYIHPLSGTIYVNDMTWAREGQCLDRTRMDGCLKSPDEMSDMRARSRWHDQRVVMTDDPPRLGMTSRHINHVDGDRDDKMRRDGALRDLGPEQKQGRAK